MAIRTDILVQSRDGWPVAAVEIKNRENWTAELAGQLRRNMVVHGALPRVPYFLLISQEKGFVWKQESEQAAAEVDLEPEIEFDMPAVVREYTPPELAGRWLHNSTLEMVVRAWLHDLISGTRTPLTEPERALKEIGLTEAMADARLLSEALH